jgi:hypothetical protein
LSPINIAVPGSLTTQRAELEATLAGIASEEEKLALQRKDIQAALNTITTAVAILCGQTLPEPKPAASGTTRKPMSAEARQRIAEGLRRAAQAKAIAKDAQAAASAPTSSAPEPADAAVDSAPETPAAKPDDAPVVITAPQEPADAPADALVPDSPKGPRGSRKAAKAR